MISKEQLEERRVALEAKRQQIWDQMQLLNDQLNATIGALQALDELIAWEPPAPPVEPTA